MNTSPLIVDPQSRVGDYIREGSTLVASRFGIDFDADTWQFPAKRASGKYAKHLTFEGVPEPIKSFFKAIVGHEAAQKNGLGQVATRNFITFTAHLVPALRGISDPSEISIDHFNAATASIREASIAEETKHHHGKMLGYLAGIISRNRLSKCRIDYHSPFSHPNHLYHTDSESQKLQRDKVIPPGALKAFGEIYQEVMRGTGNDPDRLLVSTTSLLLCTGYRIHELLTMPVDCWHERKGRDSEGRVMDGAFLGFAPEKNGLNDDTMPRWIPTSLVPVVKQSLDEILRITEPFRENARALTNGGVNLPTLEEGRTYSGNETATILGVFQQNLNEWLHRDSRFRMVKGGGRTGKVFKLSAEDIREVVRMKSFREKVVSDPWQQELHESLFVVGHNFFQPKGSVNGTATLVTYWNVYKPSKGSCFERFNKLDPDTGKPWKISTHDPRHTLNTWMMLGGFSEEEIAQYFSRQTTKDNANYDHMKNWQRVEIVRSALEKGNFRGPWADIQKRIKDPIKRDEVRNVMLANVSMSQLGICAHQEGSKPPSTPEACARCPGLIIVKGNPGHIARTREQLDRAEKRIGELQKELAKGTFGMGPWVQAEIERRDGLLAIMQVHMDSKIQDNTLVQIPRERKKGSDCR